MKFYLFRCLTLLCLFALGNLSLAAETTVYRGTLGKAAVVMELARDADGKGYAGRYFYPAYGVDIALTGPLDHLLEPMASTAYASLHEQGSQVDIVAAQWNGQLTGKTFSGTWTRRKDGRTLPFSLTEFARYDPEAVAPDAVEAITQIISPGIGSGISVDAEINAKSAPYDFLKMTGVSLKLDKVIGDQRVAFQYVMDPRTRFWFPRLVRHPDPKRLQETNRILEQVHWSISMEGLACLSSDYVPVGADGDDPYVDINPATGTLGSVDKEVVEVSYLSTTLMSFTIAGSTFCGGAHPNNHIDVYTLDLLRGGALDFDKLFHLRKRKGDEEFVIDPRLAKLLMNPNSGKGGEDIDWCIKNYMAFYFPEKDTWAVVASGAPHVTGVCNGTAEYFEFSRLKPILRPGAAAYLGEPSVLPTAAKKPASR